MACRSWLAPAIIWTRVRRSHDRVHVFLTLRACNNHRAAGIAYHVDHRAIHVQWTIDREHRADN